MLQSKSLKLAIHCIFLGLIFNTKLFSQIDTTTYFPLNEGNYWEYWSIGTEVSSWFIWAVNDTVMDNGRHYMVMKNKIDDRDPFNLYYRLDSLNNLYQYIIRPECDEKDELLYDFSVADSTIWPICGSIGSGLGPYFYCVFKTQQKFYNLFSQILKTKWFTHVLIDTTLSPPDTVWDPIYGSMGTIKIAKGAGVVERLAEFSPWSFLTGAIINGEQYGTITSIIDEDGMNSKTLKPELYIDIYPNPFNNATQIKISNPVNQIISILLYDILGRRISPNYQKVSVKRSS